MKKNFVLDTNVLLHDPRSIFGFDDNDVVIPIYVIEEIDNFKRDLSTLGRNARQVSRYLDEFRAQGKLREGVSIGPEHGIVRVLTAERKLPPEMADGEPLHRRQDPGGGGRAARSRAGQADGLRVQGHEPTHPRRRAGPPRRGLRRRGRGPRRAVERHLGARRLARGGERLLRQRDHPVPARRAAASQRLHPAPGPDQPAALRGGQVLRRQAGAWCSSSRRRRRASGASGPATRSSPSRSTCCSTTR